MTTTTSSKNPTILSLFVKALFPRFLFLAHGMGCIWIIATQEKEKKYWYLSTCLVLLVFEGIFNVIVRHGREFHWFCPSAFFYGVVLATCMSVLRERQVKCISEEACELALDSKNPLAMLSNDLRYETLCSIVEQTGMLVLIIGRWLLPQGHISREAFSQILLIYIGTAADIVEFSEIYGETDLEKRLAGDTENVLHGVMAVWALSVMQFSITIALPEEGIRDEEESLDETEDEEIQQASYFRAKISNKVAPMSYMHYKSMLREGFNQENNTVQKKHVRNPTEAQQAFREKYEQTSKTLQSLRLRAGTSESERKLKMLSSKGDGKERPGTNSSNKLPPLSKLPPLPTVKSSTSLNTMKSTEKVRKAVSYSGSPSTPRVRLPNGERVASSIGSPKIPRNEKFNSLPTKSGLKSPQQSIRSNKSTLSDDSKRYNFSTDDNHNRKISAWRRLVDTAPFSRKRRREKLRKDSTKEDNSLGIGKKEINNCFLKYLDLIGILIPVFMQDGPFFILRFVLVAHYNVVTEMIFLLVTKNALVIIIQIYRILLMYCSEPNNEPEMEDPSHRVRTALTTAKKLSQERSFRNDRVSIAIQAISRMQPDASHSGDNVLEQLYNGDLQNGHTAVDMSV